ncbi:glycosyltransferase family 2 protein [Nonlabens ponticola]|uniref:Glycosyltransferase family 2 protein n=1 Tax=Nonlabens ponticola TaxID=2496866 RepID=A0A3S9MX12_9FLAO|nr:glycosyltransferase family 2 protein [Nonlabens ponticola]AZQ43678.1 glycosyltransferase family 2 protein [Nonlabens ponticola]
MTQLSIIILNYNASAFLELCVESVLVATQNIKSQIIVADNASTDNSLMRIKQYSNQVEIIEFDKNYGFSKGNNLAVQQATGEYICLLNPDTIVGSNVFDECYAFAKPALSGVEVAQSQVGFIGVQLIDGSGTYLPESKRRVPTKSGVALKKIGVDSKYYDQRFTQDERAKTEVLVGAFMMGKKSTYEKLGGLDERYFMYGEDIDLSFTALKNGFHNWYLGDLKIIHFKGESTIQDKKYRERFYNAMQLFYAKHHPESKWSQWLVNKFAQVMINKTPKSIEQKIDVDRRQIVISEDYDSDRFEVFTLDQLLESNFLTDTVNLEIIWDTKTIERQEIISFMSFHGNRWTYRFLNHSRSTISGSDSSNSRGVVKQF